MKRLYLFAIALLPMMAQAGLLEDLLNGEYNAETMSVAAMDAVLNPAGETQNRYELRHENERRLFRHSFEADYYLFDTKKNERVKMTNGPVRDAQMSPNGKYVVYFKQGNLYIYKVDYKTEVAITHEGYDIDGNFVGSEIYSGISDWLYEEEFGVTALYAFSPDNKQVAFIRLDEKEVPTMTWQNYLEKDDYPTEESLRYPKAGKKNAAATLCVYDIYYKSIKEMQLPEQKDSYLPRLRWTNPVEGKAPEVIVERLNRDQNKMEVFSCNPASTLSTLLYKEESKDYCVDYSLFDEWQWLRDNRIVILSESKGWRSAYLATSQGQVTRQLTEDGIDVTAIYGMDEQAGLLYYQAATTPETRDGYVLNIKKGVNTRLTTEEGMHDLRFSQDMKQYIDCYQSVETPNRYTLYTAAGKRVKELKNNDALKARWADLHLPEMQFGTFKTERGDELHYWYLEPLHDGLSKNGKMPVVMTQYSGPASQRVLNRWRKRWDYYLAEQGYMVVCVDPRGTDCRGTQFRKQTYMELGRKEAEDQLSFAEEVASWQNVDAARVAMIGWSYGGFQVLRTLSEQGRQQKSVIKAGVAIAPVTDWRLYDSAYTERYMRRPQVNDGGYKAADLSSMAADLTGNLLIVHGLSDDNVHAQHTLRYVDALVEAGKQFEMQVYPDDNHFLRKRSNYVHLHKRLLLFLEKNL